VSILDKSSDRRTTAQAVQDRVVELIVERGLVTGASLPTEPEIMSALGVSRNSVREALKGLQALGIVEIRHGYGTFVGAAPLRAMEPALLLHARISGKGDRRSLHDMVEIRALLENGLIRRSAVELTGEHIAALELELAALEEHGEAEQAKHDHRFHELLYEPLGNQMALELIGMFWDVYHQLEGELGRPETDAAQTVHEHRMIIEALRARDPERAAEMIDRHFADVRARIDRLPAAVPAERPAGRGLSG
jgi:DNA-binding FadR family transcriptional regulator